jgi:hypothetical protein
MAASIPIEQESGMAVGVFSPTTATTPVISPVPVTRRRRLARTPRPPPLSVTGERAPGSQLVPLTTKGRLP